MKMIERILEDAAGLVPRGLPCRRGLILACLCLLGLDLAGCGRRGPPEPPPGALSTPSERPMQEANPYSNAREEALDAADNGSSATIGGTGRPAIGLAPDQPNQPIQSQTQGKPKKSFFLDPML